MPLILGDGVDQAAEFADQPLAELDAIGRQGACQGKTLADEVCQTPLPALITVVKEINEPRLPSLKNMMRAKQAKITAFTQKELNLDAQSIGLCGSPTQVVKIFTPPQRIGGQILTGEIPEIANQLVTLLKDEVH